MRRDTLGSTPLLYSPTHFGLCLNCLSQACVFRLTPSCPQAILPIVWFFFSLSLHGARMIFLKNEKLYLLNVELSYRWKCAQIFNLPRNALNHKGFPTLPSHTPSTIPTHTPHWTCILMDFLGCLLHSSCPLYGLEWTSSPFSSS